MTKRASGSAPSLTDDFLTELGRAKASAELRSEGRARELARVFVEAGAWPILTGLAAEGEGNVQAESDEVRLRTIRLVEALRPYVEGMPPRMCPSRSQETAGGQAGSPSRIDANE